MRRMRSDGFLLDLLRLFSIPINPFPQIHGFCFVLWLTDFNQMWLWTLFWSLVGTLVGPQLRAMAPRLPELQDH